MSQRSDFGKTTRRGFLGTVTAATALRRWARRAPIAQDAASHGRRKSSGATGSGRSRPSAHRTARATGPSPRRWRSRRRDTSSSSRAGMVRSSRERRPIMASRSSRRSSRGGKQAVREYGKTIEKAVAGAPDVLAPLKLHYLRWVLFDIGNGTVLHVPGHFRHRFRQIHRGCRCSSSRQTGINTVFENLEGFPRTGKPTLRPSSSSFATTSARAFWSTASIRMSRPTRSRRR